MVDRGGLENRYTFGYPGFESLSLRKMAKKPKTSAKAEVFFMQIGGWEFTHKPPICIKKQLSEGKVVGFFGSLQGPRGEREGSRNAAT